jgi:hypothetical protein
VPDWETPRPAGKTGRTHALRRAPLESFGNSSPSPARFELRSGCKWPGDERQRRSRLPVWFWITFSRYFVRSRAQVRVKRYRKMPRGREWFLETRRVGLLKRTCGHLQSKTASCLLAALYSKRERECKDILLRCGCGCGPSFGANEGVSGLCPEGKSVARSASKDEETLQSAKT